MISAAKYGWIPALIVVGGVALHSAPAGLMLMDRVGGQQGCDQVEPLVDVQEPERAATLAAAVLQNPDAADCALQGYGMDREGFMDLMDGIAADPRLASVYMVQLEQRSQRP